MRQERFASSPEFERGLMGNLVARRVSLLENSQDRELIWFIQWMSHKTGGLAKVARELIALRDSKPQHKARPRDVVEMFGTSVSGDVRDHAEDNLENYLAELCLNPEIRTDSGPYYFEDLTATIREYRSRFIEERRRSFVVTDIGRQVFEMLDYSRATRCMTLTNGKERIGKTESVKAWCDMHPGIARYVEVPPTNDEIGLYHAIAKSLGVSINLNSKAHELRGRIEQALETGDLILIFDQAHDLWPTSMYRDALPKRLNWVMSLVNREIAIALVTTPQFLANQKAVEDRTRWTSGQFLGRIGRYLQLPDALDENDLRAVAKALLPGADDLSIKAVIQYAAKSLGYLNAIRAVSNAAKYIAKQQGRDKITRADIAHAVKNTVIPSDSALNTALYGKPNGRESAAVEKLPAPRNAKPAAQPLQSDFQAPETDLQPIENQPSFNRVNLPASTQARHLEHAQAL